jgi:periplasmic divalent cation tolerance protein
MWEGSIDCSPEVAILFKTINANYEILEKRIKEIHPFKIPCIISIPINKGLDQYLGWLSDSLKQN